MVKIRKYFGFHKRRSDQFGTRQDLAANRRRVFLPNNVAELCSCYVLFAVLVGKQAKPAAEPGVAKQNEARRPVSRVLSPLARVMAIHLGRPLPDASRDLPGRRRGNPPADVSPRAAPIWSCSRWGLPCHCRYRQRGALLPHPFTLARLRPGGRRRAVCFLWHFPWGRPRRALPGTVFPWSPDFPPPAPESAKGSHPAVWQT